MLLLMPSLAPAQGPAIDPAARDLVKRSMAFLGGLKTFSLETHATIEVVLETGQKLQFDHGIAATVQRPNRLHAVRLGELVNQEIFYDGESLTLHELDSGFFATVAVPNTLEGMLDFARESLDLVAPAGDFIYADAYEILMDGVQSGFTVGEAWVEGVPCDHLAFRKPELDFQLWIEQGERPLPRRIVITTRDVIGEPQYTVAIRDWNLDPEVPEGLFDFEPPKGAIQVEFLMVEED
jgi:hypothetical protein